MVSGSLTLGSAPSISRTSRGAAITDSAVATTNTVTASVTNRRTKAAPPSGSSRSARASTGTKIAVKVASNTRAAIRFGSWLATVKELESAAPRIAASNTMRIKPVILLTKVASAIPHECDTTAASVSSARRVCGSGVIRRPPADAAAGPNRRGQADRGNGGTDGVRPATPGSTRPRG